MTMALKINHFVLPCTLWATILCFSIFADSSPSSSALPYPSTVVHAHDFELSYRAHNSVSHDPFYSAPRNSVSAAAGTLIKVENRTNTSAYTLAPNLSLSRFMYQSLTSNGTLVPVSGYILWPYVAQRFQDAHDLPMVVWAHGTSGTNAECAPSNIQNLWHHFQAPYNLALQGLVVVATDYAGLGVSKDGFGRSIVHEYSNGPAQANDLFYSVIAARQAFAQLSQDFVVIGSSQGGGAVWAFAQKLVKEPLDGYLGTVSLSPITNLLSLPPSEQIIPLLMFYVAPLLQARYPAFTPDQIFTSEGLQALQTLQDLKGCNTIAYQLISPTTLKPGWQNNTSFRSFAESTANGGKQIRGPMLIIQGGADPIIYPPSVDAAVNMTLRNFPGSDIEYHLLPDVTHAPAMYAAQPIYIDWIKARFAKARIAHGFRKATATPLRPAGAIQSEANWFVQKMTEMWQIT